MPSRKLLLFAVAATLATLAVLYLTDWPLGLESEWTWIRIDLSGPALRESALNLISVVPLGAAWLWFVNWSSRRLGTSPLPWHFLGLIPLSLAWLWSVQSLPPTPNPQIKSWVLYYPQMSGYYHTARYDVADLPTFLAGYEARMEEGDVGHIGTHPPGLFVLHRLSWEVCRDYPNWAGLMRNTTPAGVDEAFGVLESIVRADGTEFTEADKAALWTAMLATHLASVLTVIPLFLILKRAVPPDVAWLASASWILVPALAVFLPKSDALFPFLGMTFLWLWLKSAQDRSLVAAVAAGVVFWCGSTLSLAIIPCGLAAGIFSIVSIWQASDRAVAIRAQATTALASVAAFGALCGVVWLACDVNLFRVWWLNYGNHARFYAPENFPRSINSWRWVNLIETVFAVGAPLAVVGGAGLVRTMRGNGPLRPLALGMALAWAMIWLSGKNSGEAARLWLVFFPWVCCWSAGDPEGSEPDRRAGLWFLGLQMAVCVLTVWRVGGFHP